MTRRTTNTPSTLEPEWFSVLDLADWLGVEPSAVYNARWRGRGPKGVKVGRELRFRRSEVERWLASLAE
jgi:predicted DNA-binding transcriptional regulator AlpA